MATMRLEDRWEFYLRAYASTDTDERSKLLMDSVSDDVVFTNPGGNGRTRTGLSDHISEFQGKMPGFYFRTEAAYEHHGDLLAVWAMHKPGGEKISTGYNFVQSDDDGLFRYMAGFFRQPQ